MKDQAEVKADNLVKKAEDVAEILLKHASELARRDLLAKGIDTSRIPLICNDVAVMKTDIAWIKRSVIGIFSALGLGIVGLVVALLTRGI